MNNLVIGSSGFIGKPLCEYLIKNNEKVTYLDIKENPLNDARFLTLPLSYIDNVYFLAWDVGGAKYLYDNNTQFAQLEWNVKLLTNILPQLKKNKTKFIFVSSHLSDNTDNVYGITKKLGEIWTNLIGGINIRLWNIYGPYEESTVRSHVIGDFIHQALTTGIIKMMTDGSEQRQFIYIDDLIYIMKHIMDNCKTGTYDITTDKWISIIEIAKIISNITNCKIIQGNRKGSEVKINAKNIFNNWTPPTSIYEGLEKTIKIYKQSISTNNSL